MQYLIDTNICIYIIKKQPIQVIQRLQQLDIGDVAISSITVAELEYGVEKSAKPIQNRIALTEFLSPFEILDFDDNAAREFGVIRSQLERTGNVIGPYDMQIAAHALCNKLTLVTNNVKEFQRVDRLKIENWV